METFNDPVNGPEPEALVLAKPPLARVLCQVTYPTILSAQDRSFIAPFQEAIRAAYPLLKQEFVQNVNIGPQGPKVSNDVIWRFLDPLEIWRVTLAPSALTVETRIYSSRTEFMRRLDALLEALAGTIRPSHMSRVGIRYVNHFPVVTRADAASVFREGLIGSGIMAASTASSALHMVSEMAAVLEEGGTLFSRWGILPPGGSHDQGLMTPVSVHSCFLDIDGFEDWQAAPRQFDPHALSANARRLAGRCHTFFRWAVSEKFLAGNSISSFEQAGVWTVTPRLQ